MQTAVFHSFFIKILAPVYSVISPRIISLPHGENTVIGVERGTERTRINIHWVSTMCLAMRFKYFT